MILDAAFLGGLSLCLAVAAVFLCRRPIPGGPFLLVVGTGIVAAALNMVSAFPFLADVGQHNFIYASLGYSAGRSLPPENPFAAGMPANFPWVAFAIYTEGAKLLRVAPSQAAAFIGLICSAVAVASVCAMVAAWFAREQSRRGMCVAAVTMTFLAGTIFWGSFPKLGINPEGHVLSGGWWESRAMPVLTCFQIYTFPIGFASALAAYAAFVLALVRGLNPLRACLIAAGACGSALYPFSWLGLGVATAGVCLAGLFLRIDRRRLLASSLPLAAGALLGYLYVRSLRPTGAGGSLAINLAPGEILSEARFLLFYQGLLLFLCAINWRFFREQWKQGEKLPFLVLGSVIAIDAATLSLQFLDHTDYKLWAFATVCLGLLAAPTLYSSVRQAPWKTVAVLTVLMFPLSRSLWQGSLALRNLSPPLTVETHDGFLRIADPALQEPYDWISANTPTESVVIERGPVWAPVFANRSVFIGKRETGNETESFGFLTPIQVWLAEYCNFGEAFVTRRAGLVDALYTEENADVSVEAILDELPDRSFFILGRGPEQTASLQRLSKTGKLLELASGKTWKIYRLAR